MCEECSKPIEGAHGHDWAYCGTCVHIRQTKHTPKVHVTCFTQHATWHEIQGECFLSDYFAGGVGFHGIPPHWDQEKWLGKRK